ncbi:hypothetical protein LCGC14_0348000 [marine sediment metagenome]|uniref:Uncharacterized protein n=1 Tax=marine sediment metagenome TaxID=412755 RepID=A0A0F9WJS6_9ZZZZ
MTKKAATLGDIKKAANSYHKGVKEASKSFHGTYGGGIKDLTKHLGRKKTSIKGRKVRARNSLKF